MDGAGERELGGMEGITDLSLQPDGSADLRRGMKTGDEERKFVSKGEGAGGKLTFRQLVLVDLSQFLDLRRLPRQRPFNELDSPPDRSPDHGRVRHCLRHHLDDADPWVVGPAVVHPIFEIAQPALERGRIVFVDDVAVGDHGCYPGDGGPFARGIEEGNVDCRVRFEVVCFSGFGVGVEDVVDAAAFLRGGS